MGGCTSKKTSKSEHNSIIDRGWMKEAKNIDKFVYENSNDPEKTLQLQQSYNRNINNLDFPQDFLQEEENVLSHDYIIRFKEVIIKYHINRGIPNQKFSSFLFSLFKMRIVDYQTTESTLFSEQENEELKGIDKQFFGRNKVTSNMLNMKGATSMNKILHLIRQDYPNLQYCPILPRVVQFFLWYVPEKVALKMVNLLLEENLKLENTSNLRSIKANAIKYFSTNLKFNKYLKLSALKRCRNIYNKKIIKGILEEMIDNMCVTVLPAEYLSLVFAGFLVSGILFIGNLAGNLYSLVSEYKKKTVADVKYLLKDMNLYEVIIKSHKLEYGQLKRIDKSQASFSELCSYVPTLDKPSLIFNTSDKKNQLFALIPKVHLYESMRKVFSFEQNGLLIKALDMNWKKKCLASLLLIDVGSKVIGLFIDCDLEGLKKKVFQSGSFYFEYEKNILAFNHVPGKELAYEFIENQGICIGNLVSPIVSIEYSMLDVYIGKQDTFYKKDENIIEDSYCVSNIELFLIK